MKGISTVGILILTVFLSISVLPACADPDPPGHPVPVFGYAEHGGEPAVDATVTICDVNDASKYTTVQVGESYGVPGYWKADLSRIGLGDGSTVSIKITTNDGSIVEDATYIVDAFSPGGMAAPPPASDGNGGTGGGGDGTYPPGWDDDEETPTLAPTPEATATPASTETTEPSVTTLDGEEAVTPVETVTGEAIAEQTEPTTELKTPGFEAVFMIAGLLAVAYLVLRRRE